MSFEWLDGKLADPLKIYRILRNKGLIPRDERMERMIQERIKHGLVVKTEKFKPTFSEKISGKSLVEIEKEREKRLKEAWKRREKEAELYGHGE